MKVRTVDYNFILDTDLLPKEIKLILLLIKTEEEELLNLDEGNFADINWDRFLQLTFYHGVFPMVYFRLKKLNAKGIPPYVLESLHKSYCVNTLEMLYLSREMEYVCRLFAENDIRLLLLKGPVLAHGLYGDISQRKSVDLDILVALDDLDRVEKLLKDNGYQKDEFFSTALDDWKWRIHHINFVHPKTKIKLEIHWRLNPGPGKEPGFDELWERRKLSKLSDCPIYYNDNEDLFLHLVTHGARHGWSRIIWIMDIDKLVRQGMDLDKLNRLLKKYQCRHVGGQALVLAAQLLDSPVAEEMEVLQVGNRSKKLAQEALFYLKQIVKLHAGPVPDDISSYHKWYLFGLMSNRQKLIFILSMFYPYTVDAETLPLPKYLHFLYVPLRPMLCGWRKLRGDK